MAAEYVFKNALS